MDVRKTIDGMYYGGTAHNYYWNPSINPEATVANGLPNCTTFAYSAALESGLPAPVYKLSDASHWHKYLANGWICKPYSEYKDNLKVGDILEWTVGNHVAIVSTVGKDVYISGSFYTGIHGKAYYDGNYDTRAGITSLKQLCDEFYYKYQYRFFHYVPLSTENSYCGAEPEYVLVAPSTINPVARDINTTQVYVGVNGLRVRVRPDTDAQIRGSAAVGYYNVSKVVTGGDFVDSGVEGNTWYKIDDYYIAGVPGVDLYEAESSSSIAEIENLLRSLAREIETLQHENEKLNNKLDKIREIVE